ncbi:MAG: hypothetical protein LBD59_02730 [Prevotellaceae bacterium]|jgi:hypothetical protein|nr:hypothetical protein [Prevotellaceae bacterium]
MEIFILTSICLACCFVVIGIRIWIKGEFAETEIGRNKNMQKLGISCAKDDETVLHGNGAQSDAACKGCALLTKCKF